MKRIAVLVSGGGTNLQALIDAQHAGEIVGGEIVAVVSSDPTAYALQRAANANIPGYVVSRKDYSSNQAMTVALVEQLKSLEILKAHGEDAYVIGEIIAHDTEKVIL